MTPYSTTYAAEIVKVVTILAAIWGLDIDVQALETTVALVILVATSAWTLVERYKKGGVSAFGIRY